MELNREAAAHARDRLGLSVSAGALDQIPLDSGSFDAIVFREIIDHFRDPAGSLRIAWEAVKPGGRIVLTGLDTKSPVRFFHFKPPEHLHYFSMRNLSLLLRNIGFEIVEARPYLCYYDLADGIRHLLALALGDGPLLQRLMPPARSFPALMPTNALWILARKPGKG